MKLTTISIEGHNVDVDVDEQFGWFSAEVNIGEGEPVTAGDSSLSGLKEDLAEKLRKANKAAEKTVAFVTVGGQEIWLRGYHASQGRKLLATFANGNKGLVETHVQGWAAADRTEQQLHELKLAIDELQRAQEKLKGLRAGSSTAKEVFDSKQK